MPTAKAPDFYTLNPKKNCVLFCEQVNGELGKFKYIPVEELPLGNSTVGQVIESQNERIKELETRLSKTEELLKKAAKLAADHIVKKSTEGNDF